MGEQEENKTFKSPYKRSSSIRQVTPRSFGAGWVGKPYGDKQHFVVKHDPEDVAMTAALVNTELFIPYPHRFVQIFAMHVTAANVKDTTALAAGVFQRKEWHAGDVAASQWHDLYDFSGVVASDFVQWGGEGWEYEAGYYRFGVNTTNLHLMKYGVRIQFLDKKGKELGQGRWAR